jgi:PDZ domain-containing protein
VDTIGDALDALKDIRGGHTDDLPKCTTKG